MLYLSIRFSDEDYIKQRMWKTLDHQESSLVAEEKTRFKPLSQQQTYILLYWSPSKIDLQNLQLINRSAYNCSCRPFALSAASGSERFKDHNNYIKKEFSLYTELIIGSNDKLCTEFMADIPVWRAVCTNSGPKKLPPIPIATTSFNIFPVAPTWDTHPLASVLQTTDMEFTIPGPTSYPWSTSDPFWKVFDFV